MIDHRRNGPRRNGRPVADCYIYSPMFVALFTIGDLATVNSLSVDLEAIAADLSVDLAAVASNLSVDSAADDSAGR